MPDIIINLHQGEHKEGDTNPGPVGPASIVRFAKHPKIRDDISDDQRKVLNERLKCPRSNTNDVTSYDISAAVAGKPWDENLLHEHGYETPMIIEKPHRSGSRYVYYCNGHLRHIPKGKKCPE